MKSVIVLSLSDLERDPRVSRQIDCLSKGYLVKPLGYNPPSRDFPESVDLSSSVLSPKGGSRRFSKVKELLVLLGLWRTLFFLLFWRLGGAQRSGFFREGYVFGVKFAAIVKVVRHCQADLLIANDLFGFVIAAKARGSWKILFDAHEFSPGQNNDDEVGRAKNEFARRLLKRYLPRCDGMMTVSDGIADRYRDDFGIDRPRVVLNAAPFFELTPSVVRDDKIRLVHHGVAAPARQLEVMIDMFEHLDSRFSLDFYLMPADQGYEAMLRKRAAPHVGISFKAPLPMRDLPRSLNCYDLGVYILSPTNFNQEQALPNKLFEFVQARLGVAIGPSPQMAAIVTRCGLGVVSEDFGAGSMARALNALGPSDVGRFKESSHAHARELSSEEQEAALRDMVSSMIGQ